MRQGAHQPGHCRPSLPRQPKERLCTRTPRVPCREPSIFLSTKEPPLMSQRRDRIAFVTSAIPEAEMARDALRSQYGDVAPADADVIVALGGDGLMLQTLHKFMEAGKPIYGMNRGTVGFMMNEYREDALKERLAAAEESVIHPLAMRAVDASGDVHELLAITPISPFRPRRWRGALLPDTAVVRIEALQPDKRPVAAVADHDEVRFVRTVDVRMEHKVAMRMLFDPGHNLDERILREQF